MSLTYGFYNAKNHDRRYNAIQMSSIFDGIIEDGIFMTIGNCLRVTQNSGMMINVSPGRAWFDHTWTLNDALLPLTVPESEIILNRIDAVILEVNAEPEVRANSIKILKGTPASSPARPNLTKTESVHQYALAYIRVNARVTEIRTADITSMIGTNDTPYVTGPLKTISIESMVAQWEDQWKAFFEKETADMEETHDFWKDQWRKWFQAQTTEIQQAYLNWEYQWKTFYNEHVNDITETADYWREMWEKWFYDYVNKSSAELAYWKELLKGDFVEYSTFWKEEWRKWFEAQAQEIQNAYLNWEAQWTIWYQTQTAEMEETNETWKTMWQTWFYNYVNNNTEEFAAWRTKVEKDFIEWWESIKGLLDDPTAEFAEELLKLSKRISLLEEFDEELVRNHGIHDSAEDDSGSIILDSEGEIIYFRKVVFVTGDELERLLERIERLEELVARG